MKNIILIALFGMFCLSATAQRELDTVHLVAAQTYFSEPMNYPKHIQVLCTETAGTSDGTLYLQASVDGTSWVEVASEPNMHAFFPNDTTTVTDGAVLLISIEGKPFPYYRIRGDGTASDGTDLFIKWFKE